MLSANRYALTRPWKDACPETPMPPVCAKSLQSCPTLSNPMDCSPPGSSVMGFSRQDTKVGCHALLHRIFLTQGSNPRLLCLLHWQSGSLLSEPAGKPVSTCKNKDYFSGSAITLGEPTSGLLQSLQGCYLHPENHTKPR